MNRTDPTRLRTGSIAAALPRRSAGCGSWAAWLPRGIALAVGVLVWLIFRPALMSPDSLQQYGQALRGQFNTWHPPIMAILLRLVLQCGGTIGALMFAQCLAGVFGVRALAAAFLRSLSDGRRSVLATEWLALLITLLLCVPVTPLIFYLMTFWKDAWLAILLLWVGALSLSVLDNRVVHTQRGAAAKTILLSLLMAFATLTRHNAIVLLPVFMLIGLRIALRHRLRWPAAWGLLPLALTAGGPVLMKTTFPVHQSYLGNHVKVMDLLGLLMLDPSLRAELPYTSAHLPDNAYQRYYHFGYLGEVIDHTPPVLNPGLLEPTYNEDLDREYWQAVRRHPGLIAAVKWRAFQALLGYPQVHYLIQAHLDKNAYGLELNPTFESWRKWLLAVVGTVIIAPRVRWISTVHLVWLSLGLGGFAAGLVVWFVKRWRGARAGAPPAAVRSDAIANHLLLLALPLAYYFSHLLAVGSWDFRFMYPATLFLQVFVSAAAIERAFGVAWGLLGTVGLLKKGRRSGAGPLRGI